MEQEIAPARLAETLGKVQELDTEIQRLKKEIEELPEKHRLSELAAELEEDRLKVEASEKAVEDLEQKQHKLDGELDLLATKVSKEEQKLFSGTIMNPKELSSIQAEIISLRKKRDEMETEDLEEMESIDRLHTESESLARDTEEILERQRKAQSVYEDELAADQMELAALERNRDALKADLPEELVRDYEKLLESKAGLAVARIIQGRSCSGCRIEFSRSQIDTFQHGEGVFRCEYCRRMLVK